jgi:hypothetical protein
MEHQKLWIHWRRINGDIAKKAQDTLKRARNMEEKYATLIRKQINEGGDPQLARNLEFSVPTAETLAGMYIKNPPYVDKNHDEVRATPIENIVAAKELLENNQSPGDGGKTNDQSIGAAGEGYIITKARIRCCAMRSSTASKARGNINHGTCPDNESHTRSSEARRREARNRADAIPISSDNRPHGKGQQRNPSPPHKNYHAYGYHQDKAAPRHKSNMPPPKYKTFEIPHGGIVICDNDGKRDGAMTMATETSRHDKKTVEMVDPSKGNNLAMTTACTAAVTRISIDLHVIAMTKGKAPAAMTMIQLHEEQKEAVVVGEIHRRTSRAKGVTLHHPHQAAPMAAVAAQPGHAPPKKIHGIRNPTTRVPT